MTVTETHAVKSMDDAANDDSRVMYDTMAVPETAPVVWEQSLTTELLNDNDNAQPVVALSAHSIVQQDAVNLKELNRDDMNDDDDHAESVRQPSEHQREPPAIGKKVADDDTCSF